MPDATKQWQRSCTVVVGKKLQGAINTNQGTRIRGTPSKDGEQGFRIVFQVEKSVRSAPNTANIQIYNLHPSNEAKIKNEFDDVVLEAGYIANPRVIFRGNIKRVFKYRDGTDWITEIQAADGDKDYNNAIVNQTLAAGKSPLDVVGAVLETFGMLGGTKRGYVKVSSAGYTRGRVLSGPARTILDQVAVAENTTWSIQDGLLEIVEAGAVLPVEAIVVNMSTGLIGAPEISDKGLLVKTLLNPQIRCKGRMVLDNNDIKIKTLQLYTNGPKTKAKNLVRLDPDGRYWAYKLTHKGDTRGNDWTTESECVAQGSSAPKA